MDKPFSTFYLLFLGLIKKKNQQYLHLLQPSHHLRRKNRERRSSLYLLLRSRLSPLQTLETCLKDTNMSATTYASSQKSKKHAIFRKLKELKVELKAKFSFNTKEVAVLCRSKSSIIFLRFAISWFTSPMRIL